MRVWRTHVVSETGCVNDSQLDFELLLLELSLDDLNLYGLVQLLCMPASVVLACAQLGRKEGVDD